MNILQRILTAVQLLANKLTETNATIVDWPTGFEAFHRELKVTPSPASFGTSIAGGRRRES